MAYRVPAFTTTFGRTVRLRGDQPITSAGTVVVNNGVPTGCSEASTASRLTVSPALGLPFWNVVYVAPVSTPDLDATKVCIRRSPAARMSHQVRNPSTPSAWSRSAGTVCPPGEPTARSSETLVRQADGAVGPSAGDVSRAPREVAQGPV